MVAMSLAVRVATHHTRTSQLLKHEREFGFDGWIWVLIALIPDLSTFLPLKVLHPLIIFRLLRIFPPISKD